jgi:hypothetical protein
MKKICKLARNVKAKKDVKQLGVKEGLVALYIATSGQIQS